MSDIILFDKSKFPIVIVSTPRKEYDDKMVDEYIKEMTNFYTENQGKNVVIIYDITVLNAINAKSRIKIGEWLKEKTTLIKNAVAGVCYVQKSVLQKIILQGIFTIKAPEWQNKIVTSNEEGIKWAEEILKKI